MAVDGEKVVGSNCPDGLEQVKIFCSGARGSNVEEQWLVIGELDSRRNDLQVLTVSRNWQLG